MNFSFLFSPKSITRLLLAIIFFLFLASAASLAFMAMGYNTAFGLVPLFHFDLEFNIPSLYSTLAILFCSALLRFISFKESISKGKQQGFYWKVLSYIFLYLGFDELMSLHEHIGGIAHHWVGDINGLNESRYWTIPFIFLLILFFLFFVRFFLELPNQTKVSFFVAGFMYVTGAVGVELFSGQFILAHPRAGLLYHILSIFEELLEMIGIVLFIRALVSYIADYITDPHVNINLTAQKSKH
jgi:hypothetical protein